MPNLIMLHIQSEYFNFQQNNCIKSPILRKSLFVLYKNGNIVVTSGTFQDSGNYTCMMGRTARTQIELQIIPGKYDLSNKYKFVSGPLLQLFWFLFVKYTRPMIPATFSSLCALIYKLTLIFRLVVLNTIKIIVWKFEYEEQQITNCINTLNRQIRFV